MALVVLLRGVNVGGHRVFRPSSLAEQLRHLDAVNIGAAGTFVIRRPVRPGQLREEIARRLPLETEVMICPGGEIARLLAHDAFSALPERPDVVRFLSVLSRRPRAAPRLPLTLPPGGAWLLELLARDGRYVLGRYRRQMKAIGLLGTLDRLFGVPVTTRNLNTIRAIVRALPGAARAAHGG